MASIAARTSAPRAMARPRCSPLEGQLLPDACRELKLEGSKSARAAGVAAEVARLAIIDVMASEDDLGWRLELSQAKLEWPAVSALATMPEIDTAGMVMAEAVAQFEARGCRHLPPSEWGRSNAELTAAISRRLRGRYRKRLK